MCRVFIFALVCVCVFIWNCHYHNKSTAVCLMFHFSLMETFNKLNMKSQRRSYTSAWAWKMKLRIHLRQLTLAATLLHLFHLLSSHHLLFITSTFSHNPTPSMTPQHCVITVYWFSLMKSLSWCFSSTVSTASTVLVCEHRCDSQRRTRSRHSGSLARPRWTWPPGRWSGWEKPHGHWWCVSGCGRASGREHHQNYSQDRTTAPTSVSRVSVFNVHD